MSRQDLRAPVPRFPMAPPNYDARNESAFRQAVEQGLRGAIQFPVQVPEVKVEASRSGSSATMTLTVHDPGKRVQAIEFNKREGSAAATGWVSTWDTSTGTIGGDVELVRSEAVSIPAGLDSSAEWRMTYRDQFGDVRIRSGPIPLANLASVAKTLRFSHHGFRPDNLPSPTQYTAARNNTTLSGAAGDVGGFYAPLPIPPGVEITGITFRGAKGDALNTCEATLVRQNADDSTTNVAVATITTTGVEAISASPGSTETVGASVTYLIFVNLEWDAAAVGSAPSFYWVEVAYTAPDYSKTY